MAKKKDIVNDIKGSIGDFVIYKRYGKTFLRQRPKTMNHPNSDAQLEQRHKFSQSNTLAKKYRASVGHVSLETDEPKSPYNALLGLIRRTGFKGNYPEITWDWESIQFSEGSLALPEDLKFSVNQNTIRISWNAEWSKVPGTVFLIGVHPESLEVVSASDENNTGSIEMNGSSDLHYFVFKEFLDGEKTKKSGTARFLSNQIFQEKVSENLSVIVNELSEDLPNQSNAEELEIITEEEDLDEIISEEDLSDVEVSFNPDEFLNDEETPSNQTTESMETVSEKIEVDDETTQYNVKSTKKDSKSKTKKPTPDKPKEDDGASQLSLF